MFTVKKKQAVIAALQKLLSGELEMWNELGEGAVLDAVEIIKEQVRQEGALLDANADDVVEEYGPACGWIPEPEKDWQ